VFDNTSVCLYLASENNPEPAKRLYLHVLYAQQGNWTKSPYSQHIFTFHVNTISSSAALHGIIDDEKGRIADFSIGNGRKLWRLRLLLDSISSLPELRHNTVCDRNHRVVQVAQAGMNNVIVFCDNKIMLVKLEARLRRKTIALPELNGASFHSAKSFFSESGETGFLTVKSQDNITNCFIFFDTGHPSNHCKVIPNDNSVIDGVFVDKQFFSLLNHTTLAIVNTSSGPTLHNATTFNVCPSGDCYVYQTKKLLYIYGQKKTIVLDKVTHKTLTIQNASVNQVLPRIEKAYYNCNKLPTTNIISPTATTDSQPFVSSTTNTIISSTGISKSFSFNTPLITSTTSYVTTTTITQSPLAIQTTTANAEEIPLPTTSVNAESRGENMEAIIITIIVLIPSVCLLLTVILVRIGCCKNNQFHLNTEEQMLVRSKSCDLQTSSAPLKNSNSNQSH